MNAALAKLVAHIRHRPLVAACFVATAALAVVNYFLWQDRAVVTKHDDEARRNGEFMLQALNSRARIDADLAALREAMAQIEGNLLDEHSMEVNLGYFYRCEKLARVRLVRLNQLAAPPPTPGARFKSVPFSMQVTGSYRNSIAFLHALETGSRVLRIRTCSFERAGENSTDLIMELTVDVLAKT